LRSPRSNNGSLVSAPTAADDNATVQTVATQIVLAFDDNRLCCSANTDKTSR
jgi:hypothetical protein